MFTQPCLIRKNTKHLRDKLIEFGYKIPPKQYFEDRKEGLLCREKLAIGIPKNSYEFNIDEYLKNNQSIIDCGKNEDLFLALAALRDDTDVNQWFIIDVDAYKNISKGDWFKATEINGGFHVGTRIESLYCHKATVEELIEHFK